MTSNAAMSRRPTRTLSPSYLIVRLANVAVRPLTLLVLAWLTGDMVASAVALALALSSWLMAPLTFGSYRWLLPLEKRYQPNERAYRMGQDRKSTSLNSSH